MLNVLCAGAFVHVISLPVHAKMRERGSRTP